VPCCCSACTGDAASTRNLAAQRTYAGIACSARVAIPPSTARLLIAGFNAVKGSVANPGNTAAPVLLVWRAFQALAHPLIYQDLGLSGRQVYSGYSSTWMDIIGGTPKVIAVDCV
jgi:hypothetical protein